MEKQIVVVGGGPGGYVAAIRAAQLGAKVIIVEKEKIGGTCLNVGCIPTKSLLHSADILAQAKNGKKFGIDLSVESVDWPAVLKRKDQVVKQLVKGVEGLMKSNQIEVIRGTAHFLDQETVTVTSESDSLQLKPDKIILATGSKPAIPPIKGLEQVSWLDSSDALSLEELPNELIIIGGGVIGIEFASIYQRFGSQVTIIEEQTEILPAMDQELAALLRKKMMKEGVRFLLGKRVEAVKQKDDTLTVSLGEETITGEKLLVAVGRRSFVEGLGLENTKIQT
ncbi:MAG: dihydrolipoyl dehydrogenase family protein, partial [Enterococcus hulanensis]